MTTPSPRPRRKNSRRFSSLAKLEQWVLGPNQAVRELTRRAEQVAGGHCCVLISGETGTGKELLARFLHQRGPRSTGPFIPVQCAALSVTLAESQLFGHEKGAFTGAMGASLGVFRAADRGVVYLDEVGDLPPEIQPKLLRVLDGGEVTPLGATDAEAVDVQTIASTSRNLAHDVADGRFREDLYYRLQAIELRIPPLRDRVEDIPQFVAMFSRSFAEKYERPPWQPTDEVLDQFCGYGWPGNVRQLAQVIEQAYVLDTLPTLPV